MAPHTSVVARLKVHLKLSIARLRIVQAKDQAIAKQQRRAMAQLLEQGKQESARIRVENIIRSDLISELHEVLELYCELLLARIGLLDNNPATSHSSTTTTIDPGLEEAVRSIIYAAPRTDIKELNTVRALLVEKFGRDFAQQAMDNSGEVKIPERISRKLRVEPPSKELVESYLTEIANAYDVPYGESPQVEDAEPPAEDGADDNDDNNDTSGSGGQGKKATTNTRKTTTKPALETPLSTQELSAMTPPRTLDPGLTSPVRIAPPSPSTDNANPKLKLPGTNAMVATTAASTRKMDLRPGGKSVAAAKKPDGDIPDVNDLEKRFALLKR